MAETPATVSSPVVSIENLIKSPKSWAGWVGLIVSVGTFALGEVGHSTSEVITDVVLMASSALSIVLPQVIKK